MDNNEFWKEGLREDVRIFEEAGIGGLKLRNRLLRSATCEGLAGPDGSLNEELYGIYDALAEGGAGALITGFTGINDSDDALEGMMRLSADGLIPQYKELVDRVHERGCLIFSQLALGNYYIEGKPVEIDDLPAEGIEEIRQLFADAAERAEEAGFDGIQLHMAHHFFLSRSFSPLYNHREDDYGGTSVKRARLLAEVLDAVRERVPDMAVICKIDFTDDMEGGLTMSDALTVSMLLSDHGVDAIEVSAVGSARKGIRIPYDEGYFKENALAVKSVTKVPVILVGGNRTIDSMEDMLKNEDTDFFSLSRPLIREPDLPKKWEEDRSYAARCISCNTCFTTSGHRCVFRD